MSLDFITSNPATDAYQKAEKLTRENDLSDLKLATGEHELDEKKLTQPTRLRQLEANTSTAETGAQVAKDEAPYAAPMKAAGLRSANANAVNSEMSGFYKSLELLKAGDVEGAKAVSEAVGHPLPEAVIKDTELRSAVTAAADEARKLYLNRPKDQQAYITGRVAAINDARANGRRVNDPTGLYTVPGAPEPQETSDFKSRWDMLPATRANPDTGQPEQGYIHHDKTSGDSEFVSGTTLQGRAGTGGASGRKITGTEAIIGELRRENPNLSYQDALNIAKRSGQSPDALTLRKEALALSAAKADTNFLTNPDQTIETYRRKYGLGQPQSGVVQPNETITNVTSAPAPNPPAPQPGQMSPGDGTKPLNIQAPPLPANLPPGVQYSWSPARQQFRDELGRVYDKNGSPVS